MVRVGQIRRCVILTVIGLFVVFVGYDYYTYHSRYHAAISVAVTHGARVGALLDWPLGRECNIAFDRPIDRAVIEELAVLNSLTSRHWVEIAFNCDISDDDLQFARDTLPECVVFRVEDSDLQP